MSGPVWTVGFDNERIARFDNEVEAIQFAEFDSQLEDTTAVVMRHDGAGATVIATFVRLVRSSGSELNRTGAEGRNTPSEKSTKGAKGEHDPS